MRSISCAKVSNKKISVFLIASIFLMSIFFYGTMLKNTFSFISTDIENSDKNPSTTLNTINLAKESEILSHIIFDSIETDLELTYTTIIVISSHVDNRNRRNMIRETWGSIFNWVTNEKYLIVFVVARTTNARAMIEIADEAKIRRDILYLDIFEDFYLLTKKVIIALTWANKKISFKTLLKGDDDTYMHLDNIIKFVKKIDVTDGYFGNKISNAYVQREGKYQVSKEELEKDFYNPYCSGGGFILTNSSVHKMILLFDLNKIFRIDDAFIGEIAFQAGITVTQADGFFMYNSGCKYEKNVIVSHPNKDPECNNFLLKRSLIDNGKLLRDFKLENQSCFCKNAC
ncbi:N-acetyllactosaminide beta-1,3-N-acetylglucosaminyltransferase 4 isoform X2 [Hydra vulgaris]|uniref:Hexosyltransferase n=1 Tax=Hydra vulgaris TaxID=6087 RepID=A0ABM4BKN9_HYDVU